jgi:hypothetical protein
MNKTLTDEQIEDVLADAGIDFYSQGNVAGSAKDLFNGIRACVILAAQQPEPFTLTSALEWAGVPDVCRKNPEPRAEVTRLRAEIDRLNAIINTPHADEFLRAVSIEAEHQRQRWSSEHDAGKTPADWFWLVGYLAGKALHAAAACDAKKAEHHIITTSAACANWHLALFGKTDMRPGIDAARAGEGHADQA